MNPGPGLTALLEEALKCAEFTESDEEQSEENVVQSTKMASQATGGLQALYDSLPLQSSDSEEGSRRDRGQDSPDHESQASPEPLNLITEFDDASGFDMGLAQARRTVGRPVNSQDTEKNQKKRSRYRRKKELKGTPMISRNTLPDSNRKQRSRVSRRNVKAAQKAFQDGNMKEGLDLVVATMHSKAARNDFGDIVDLCNNASVEAEVGRNVLGNLKNVGSAHKLAVVRIAMSGETMDLNRLSELSGLPTKYVKSASWLSREYPELGPDRLLSEKYPVSVKRTKEEKTPVDVLIISFFESITQVPSGARRETRELLFDLAHVGFKLYAEYPQWLRKVHLAMPELLQSILVKSHAKLTRFESSLARAVQDQALPGFDAEKEEEQRWQITEQAYKNHLTHKRALAKAQLVVNMKKTEEAVDDEMKREVEEIMLQAAETTTDPVNENPDLATNNILAAGNSSQPYYVMHNPPTLPFIFKTLKKHGVRWTQNFKPTECPIHDKGELHLESHKIALQRLYEAKQALSDLQGQISQAKGQKLDVRELRKQEPKLLKAYQTAEGAHRVLRLEVQKYITHLKQYECCRAVIKKIEEDLKVGECVMYRDFVAAYNCEGKKVQNLVLVVLYRDAPNGPLKTYKFNNLCDDKKTRSADPAYVADVFEFYFGKHVDPQYNCDFFRRNKITRVYLSGDHGTHFSSIQTMYNESRFKEEYGVEFVLFFLCSYHAYNRCDGAGVETKRISIQSSKGRISLRSGKEIAQSLNDSNYDNSIAFDLVAISRPHDLFPKLVKHEYMDLRRMCEVKYTFVNEHGQRSSEVGVILCRLVPFAPGVAGGCKYEVYDLREDPPNGALCRPCSKEKQYPVRHSEENPCRWLDEICDAENPNNPGNMKRSMLAQTDGPDPNRIRGPQLEKSSKKLVGSFPCNFIDKCGHRCLTGHHYNSVSHANKHMQQKHAVPDGDSRLYITQSSSKSGDWTCNVDGCKSTFKSAKNANKHMAQQHPDQELVLHDIVNELKAAPKLRTKKVVAQVGGSDDDDDNGDVDDDNGDFDGAWGGDDGGGGGDDDDDGDDDGGAGGGGGGGGYVGGDDNGGGSGGGGDDVSKEQTQSQRAKRQAQLPNGGGSGYVGGDDNGGGGGGGGDDVGNCSEYEKNNRLPNMERNAAMLKQLGISSMLDSRPQIKRKSEEQKQSQKAKRQTQVADASHITRSRTSNTVSSISYFERSDSASESAEDLIFAEENLAQKEDSAEDWKKGDEKIAELKSDDEPTKAQMNAHGIAMQAFVQPRPPSAVAAVVVDTAAVDGKWVDDQCMVNHFALLKIENADTKAISIELVKITQTSTSEPEFKGTMYLCTQLQTSEECLHGMWYVSQTRNSPCDPESVICYFHALNNTGKLPAKAKRAATSIFK
jgi:transcriptional regulator with XRE-family HTH domain